MQRNRSIDIAKGIAISLMVIGHSYSAENYFLLLIYAFHMPFFFVVSGMLYAEKWKTEVQFDLRKSAKRLLIPYAIFETLFALLLTVLSRSESMVHTFIEHVTHNILPGIGITATWYLPCSLIVTILFVVLYKNMQSVKIQIITIAAITAVGLFCPAARVFNALWRGFVGLGFFAVGFYGSAFLKRKVPLKRLAVLFTVYLLSAYVNGQVSLVSKDYGNPILYIFNGILGSYLLIQASLSAAAFQKTHVIEMLGENSVIVLCTHMMIIEIIRLLDYKLFNSVFPRLGYMEGIIFGMMVLTFTYLLIPVCKRYFSFAFGK